MNLKTYRQADSRWGKLPYPKGRWQMHNCGCGCCACTFLIMQREKYKNYTPANVRPFMVGKGYAVSGRGTAWAGIKPTLAHYGLTNIIWHNTVPQAFNALKKNKHKFGIILFRAGTKGGITWSSVGHFVAFIDYKIKGGKHYFLVRDSGGRQHNGWYCYETQMQGLIKHIWTCDMPDEKAATTPTKKAYAGVIPTVTVKKGSKGIQVERLQLFLNWYFGKKVLAVDGSFGPKTYDYLVKFQKKTGLVADGSCGPKTRAKMKAVKK